MPVVNPLARELIFKIVYYGPGLGGKTTSLQHIHGSTRPEHRGKMVSLATPVDRTLYFDFLPLRLSNVRGLGVRLQLFTVPGQVYYNATRKLVLTGADGVVFVADSQAPRLDANLESLENLRDNLREHGHAFGELPFVLAYNKRDLDDVVSIEELEQRLNRHKAPSFATCATTGTGVFETLDAAVRLVLEDFERRMPEESGALALGSFDLAEGGLTEALKGADPPSARVELRPHEDESRLAPDPVCGEGAARAVLEGGLPDEPQPAHKSHPQAEPTAPSPASGQLSFSTLWVEGEKALAREVEGNLKRGEWAAAVLGCGALVRRSLGRQLSEEEGDALAVTLLALRIDASRYVWLRRLIGKVRSGASVTRSDALVAYLFAADVAVRTHSLDASPGFSGV